MTDARNPYAPPRASLEQGHREGFWRQGKVLVLFPGSSLPPRCVKCNEPAVTPIKLRKVHWHHPTIYLVILLNIVIYVIVAVIARKKALVAAGLCAQHKRRRRMGMLIAWIGLPAGIAGAVTAGAYQIPIAMIASLVIGLGITVAGMIVARVVYPQKIDAEYVRLKGCGSVYLDSLPEFPG